jgi:predicted dinucleotide-binding enzyme
MKIAVLGTGMVGSTIGSKFIQLGHQVMMGSRVDGNEKALNWVKDSGANASQGTFSAAAGFGELIINCTAGMGSIEALKMAGEENLNGKILVDISNPLDFSKGMPPTLAVCNTTSLGEEIQKTFAGLRVVKTLNTMWCGLMVNPQMICGGDHAVFLAGNDNTAKAAVKKNVLMAFGWNEKNIIDLGDVTKCRGLEMYLPLWLSIYGATKNGAFNIQLVS